MFRKTLSCIVTVVLVALTAACAGNAAAPQLSAASTPVRGDLTVASTSAFTDSFGIYHVVGSIQNNTTSVQSGIELSVTVKDAGGNSLLKDKGATAASLSFAPLLATLAPGETSPFDFEFNTSGGTPASSAVTVMAYQTGLANRATLNAANVQLVDDGKGTLYLTGNLVNTGAQWVSIHSLAGAVVGGSENPLSAGTSFVNAQLLAPTGDSEQRDRTPFVITLPSPGAGQTDWRVYWDADQVAAPTDYALGLNFTNSYFDQEGTYHIVGYVVNNSSATLAPVLVAGLYAEDGTVLDAADSFNVLAVDAGKTIPFDLSYFGSVNASRDQAARVRNFTVQADPARTAPPESQPVDLNAIGEQREQDNANWTFTGTVANSSKGALAGVTVIVTVSDAQGNLVATNSTYVLPAGPSIAPGDSVSYKVVVSLDPTVDSTNFQTATLARGDPGK